jgi:hypothetical protein
MLKTILLYAVGAVLVVIFIRLVIMFVSNLFKAFIAFLCLLVFLYVGLGWKIYKAEPQQDKGFIQFILHPGNVISGSFKTLKFWN